MTKGLSPSSLHDDDHDFKVCWSNDPLLTLSKDKYFIFTKKTGPVSFKRRR